jgi:hypothetical protein
MQTKSAVSSHYLSHGNHILVSRRFNHTNGLVVKTKERVASPVGQYYGRENLRGGEMGHRERHGPPDVNDR